MPDSPTRSQKEIFLAAFEITDAAGRARFLDETCAGDAGLRSQVNALLRTSTPAEFLATPPMIAVLPERGESIEYFGDYILLSEIARGSTGVVFRARQTSLNRIVALKMLRDRSHLASPDDERRFRAEAEAAAGLDHPGIVPIYEVGQHEGQGYFSMKFIEGGTLHLRAGEFREPRRAAALIAQVARAVQHAHERGILHRDLKPGNILLHRDGGPQVVDFGTARHIGVESGLTHTGQIVGTPHYMAPEQARGEHRALTPAADIYSLGAIFYELLAGRKPFAGETMLTLLRQVTEQAPAPLHLRDRDLENVALRCLEKAPADRYGSAAELADDLERWLRGEPVKARPVGVGVHFLKWMRRRPAHAALAGFAVAGALALAAFLTDKSRDSAVVRPAVIVVENASFELPDLGHDIALLPRDTTETPPGWTAAENNHGGTAVGVHDPCDILYRGTNGPVLPGTADGAQTCYMNLGSGEANTLTYSGFSLGHFVEGQTYTLTVAVGGRRDGGAPASAIGIALLAGGKPAGTGATAPAVADRFFDLRCAFTATLAEAGQPVGIRISARNASTGFQQANIDNVRLTTTRPRNFSVTASQRPDKVAARRALEWLHRVNGPRGYVTLQAEDGQLQRVKTGEPLPPGDFGISELWLDHWKAANERDLKFPSIDPADFRKHAATLKKLQMCFLRSLDLRADDLAFLSQNPDLTYLTIENLPGGGDPLIPHLARFEKLLLLNVSRFEGTGDMLTGQKLGTLACLPNLTRAYFTGSALEDADVAMLVERCGQLRDIGLGGTQITDAALRTLSRHAMNEIRLDSTGISDGGLAGLAKIPSLNFLFLYGAENITAAGVAAFQRAHPECKVVR